MDFFMEEPKVSLNGDTLTMVAKGATLTFLDKKVAVPDKPLVGTQWTARRIIDRKSVGWMQMDKYPTLHFSTDGALTIFNGCNQVKGRFTAKRSVLTLTEMAPTTMRLCAGENVQRMVAHYAKVFVDGTLSYSIDANALNIERGGDGVVAYTE